MPSISYQTVIHRNQNRILIQFENNEKWNKRIKSVDGAKWSKTLNGWTIPDTIENRIKCKLPAANTVILNRFTVNSGASSINHQPATISPPLTETTLLHLRNY